MSQSSSGDQRYVRWENRPYNSADKPERPADDDCCGGGCSPCVWDIYNARLDSWLKRQGSEGVESDPEDRAYR